MYLVYGFIALFVVFYAVWVIVMRHIGQSKVIQWGGGFIASCIVLIGISFIVGLVSKEMSKENAPPSNQEAIKQTETVTPTTETVIPTLAPDHNYSMKDGYQYGYAQAISAEDANNGQIAEQLMMFKFSGSRDGKFQVFTKDGAAASTIECENPCEFMKTMAFFQGEHIKTQHMHAAEGSIGLSVLTDAINGKLDRYVGEQNGKRVNVWYDETKGIIATPVK